MPRKTCYDGPLYRPTSLAAEARAQMQSLIIRLGASSSKHVSTIFIIIIQFLN